MEHVVIQKKDLKFIYSCPPHKIQIEINYES